MRISEYIDELKEILEKEGDLEIVSSAFGGSISAIVPAYSLQVEFIKIKTKREYYRKVWLSIDLEKLKSNEKVVKI